MGPLILGLFNIFYWAVFILLMARMIMSFTNFGGHQLRDWVYRLTEPLLAPIRSRIPMSGGIDISPMVLLFGLIIIGQILQAAFR